MLGRVIRDITRKIRGDETLESVFARPLSLARRVREQRQRERGRKLYSRHAPEVECIGRGKAPSRTRLGGRSRWPPLSTAAGAGSPWRMGRPCRATPMTGTRSPL